MAILHHRMESLNFFIKLLKKNLILSGWQREILHQLIDGKHPIYFGWVSTVSTIRLVMHFENIHSMFDMKLRKWYKLGAPRP
jgi:hypothetical protein